jgi:hypothetical protein
MNNDIKVVFLTKNGSLMYQIVTRHFVGLD